MSSDTQLGAIRVLVIEDSQFDALILVNMLKQGGFQPDWKCVETLEDLGVALRDQSWDVILADYNLDGFNAMDALLVVNASGKDIPHLIIPGGIG